MSKIKHYSLLIIGILIIIAMLYLTGIENFITEVSKANLFLIGTAAFLYLFTFPLRGLVVHLVLGPYKNKANLWESTKNSFCWTIHKHVITFKIRGYSSKYIS